MNDRIIVLSTDGNLLPIYDILALAYPKNKCYTKYGQPEEHKLNLQRRVNDMLAKMIDACRYRGRVISNLNGYINWFCMNVTLPPYPYHPLTIDSHGNVDAGCKLADHRNFKTIVKDLATAILFQLEQFGLYNENGFLEYEFFVINDQYFNEIAIKRVPQAISNGSSHDPTS